MLPTDSLVFPVMFELVVSVLATVLTCLLALQYFRRVRLERPAVGTFNGRDITILFVFIVGLPLLYIVLPLQPLLVFLGITFVSALSMGLRPLFRPGLTWLIVGVLVGGNVWMSRTLLGTVTGWQVFWVENSIIVIAGAVTVSNLYIQGGMRVKHVSYFALVLAVYDALFSLKWPITNRLAQRFLGWPLDPSVGFRLHLYNASLGLGDLLVYALFVIAVYKAWGPSAAKVAMALALVFGAIVPALAPLVYSGLMDARTDLVVPAQTSFGPVAFIATIVFRRLLGREATMAEYLGSVVPGPAAGVPADLRLRPWTSSDTPDRRPGSRSTATAG